MHDPVHCFIKTIFLCVCVACGILVPGLGIRLMPLAVEAQSLNHWTSREATNMSF